MFYLTTLTVGDSV